MKKTFSILFLLSSFAANAQFFFNRIDSVAVIQNNAFLPMAFAGGQNFLVVSEIDLDFDGTKDLFLFDRSGDKISTFLNHGIPDSVSYLYAHDYIRKFPKLNSWALLRDFNCDGKEDIFASTNAGMKVYLNTSTPQTGISFSTATSLLYAYFTENPLSQYLNLYVSPVDIPAIYDIDGDGDLDILTFDFAGTKMSYFKNHSMEWFGHCNSLEAYVLVDDCWGDFSENFSNNDVTLDVCRGSNPSADESPRTQTRHSGSCTLCAEFNGDSQKEVVLGDISFANLTLLVNDGNSATSDFISQDNVFPGYDIPVNLPLFPCAFYVDVNNDGKRDLLASANAGSCSANIQNLWYYENTAQDDSVHFNYRQNALLIDQMIDVGEGAYPTVTDYDQDGLKDIVIGNFGYLTTNCNYQSKLMLLRNTGTAIDPEFTLISRDFANLAALNLTNLAPTFGDLDGDGDDDMVVGESNGRLYYYINTAASGLPASYQISSSLFNGLDVGNFATPQLVDLNRDGKLDLVVGEGNGNLNFYPNTGTASQPAFSSTPLTDSLGKVNVTPINTITGYSAPYFFKVNGEYHLMVGSSSGFFFHYTNIDNNLTGAFTLSDDSFQDIWEGIRSSVCVHDFDNDEEPDMIVGNYCGGLHFYIGDITQSLEENEDKLVFKIFPNPSNGEVTVEFQDERFIQGASIQVFNQMGQMVFEKNANLLKSQTIDLSELKNGFYVLQVNQGQAKSFGKLIKTSR
jgi:hypothetical protein